jgi:hypothetical protein
MLEAVFASRLLSSPGTRSQHEYHAPDCRCAPVPHIDIVQRCLFLQVPGSPLPSVIFQAHTGMWKRLTRTCLPRSSKVSTEPSHLSIGGSSLRTWMTRNCGPLTQSITPGMLLDDRDIARDNEGAVCEPCVRQMQVPVWQPTFTPCQPTF